MQWRHLTEINQLRKKQAIPTADERMSLLVQMFDM